MRVASLTDAPYAFGAKLEDVLAQSERSFDEVAQRHSTSDMSTSFFLFSGAESVGTIGAYFEQSESHRGFICALWVEPGSRGTPAGSLLVTTAVDWLIERGAKEVFAWVADEDTRAFAFYRKFGFIATREVQPLPSNPLQIETLLCFQTTGG
jgi:ribosomal protein S18 acetylase RimI-like enzyme